MKGLNFGPSRTVCIALSKILALSAFSLAGVACDPLKGGEAAANYFSDSLGSKADGSADAGSSEDSGSSSVNATDKAVAAAEAVAAQKNAASKAAAEAAAKAAAAAGQAGNVKADVAVQPDPEEGDNQGQADAGSTQQPDAAVADSGPTAAVDSGAVGAAADAGQKKGGGGADVKTGTDTGPADAGSTAKPDVAQAPDITKSPDVPAPQKDVAQPDPTPAPTPTPAPAPTPAPSAPAGWKLVWSDEFDGADGSAPDASKWVHDVGDASVVGGNSELEYYTAGTENIQQKGGNLVITARADGGKYNCWYGACKYTSARITTKGKFEQTYGRFESRLKMPAGKGLWPAFWMLGDTNGHNSFPLCGEIDIMENIGDNHAYGTVHGQGYDKGGDFKNSANFDTFHVFATEWDASSVKFFVDDTLYFTAGQDVTKGNVWAFDHPFYMLLNLAVGGTWPGSPDGSVQFPVEMQVDYVRVYTKQ